MTTDPHIRDILERARQGNRATYERLSEESRQHREESARLDARLAELTDELDAIDAELGVGAFADLVTVPNFGDSEMRSGVKAAVEDNPE